MWAYIFKRARSTRGRLKVMRGQEVSVVMVILSVGGKRE